MACPPGERAGKKKKSPGLFSAGLEWIGHDQNWNPAETPNTAKTPISLSDEQGQPVVVVQESSRLR